LWALEQDRSKAMLGTGCGPEHRKAERQCSSPVVDLSTRRLQGNARHQLWT
jgi:hypothetical protein